MASDKTCTFRSDAGDVLVKIARIDNKLVSEKESEAVLDSLLQLQAMPMTFEALGSETTKIGQAINALRKTAPSEKAREVAAALYKGWRALADEHFVVRQATAPAAPMGHGRLRS
jgi:hypothetical protein